MENCLANVRSPKTLFASIDQTKWFWSKPTKKKSCDSLFLPPVWCWICLTTTAVVYFVVKSGVLETQPFPACRRRYKIINKNIKKRGLRKNYMISRHLWGSKDSGAGARDLRNSPFFGTALPDSKAYETVLLDNSMDEFVLRTTNFSSSETSEKTSW